MALELGGPEASDFLNFVLKDAATGTWYDFNGSNFHVPLRSALVTASMTMSFDLDDEARMRPASVADGNAHVAI